MVCVVMPIDRKGSAQVALWVMEPTLKIADVCAIIGVKRWQIYYNIRFRNFPAPIKKNNKHARWNEQAVREWKALNCADAIGVAQ